MSDIKEFAANNNWSYCVKKNFTGLTSDKKTTIILLPTWSNKDIQLINTIKNKIDKSSDIVNVFDIDDFRNQDELKKHFPGEPHPKAVPRNLEISGFFKCFFTYSSGVILSSAEWGLNSL